MERASVTADPESPSPQELRRYVSEIFSSIDERPRKLYVEFDVRGACAAEVSVDMVDGEPVFRIGGQRPAKCPLARRWLAEHPVPLVFCGFRTCSSAPRRICRAGPEIGPREGAFPARDYVPQHPLLPQKGENPNKLWIFAVVYTTC